MPLWIGVIWNNRGLALAAVFLILAALVWARLETVKLELVKAKSEEKDARDLLDQQLKIDAAVRAANQEEAKAHAKSDATIAAQLESAYRAHDLTGSALTASVQQYQDSLHQCAVSKKIGASGGAGPLNGRPAPSQDRRPDQILSEVPALAQKALDQLRACQATLKERTS